MTSFVAEPERVPGYTHVLLITTGSVASVKAPLIVKELLTVRVLCTHHAGIRQLIRLVRERESGSCFNEGIPRFLRKRRH